MPTALTTSLGTCEYDSRNLNGHTVMLLCSHMLTAVSGTEKQARRILVRKHVVLWQKQNT